MSDKYGKGHDYPEDAAAAALMALGHQPRSDEQEYMGLIIQDPNTGKYYRTGFQTQGSKHSSEWTGRPEGKVAGIVHNHPRAHTGNKYPSTHLSPQDVTTARELGAPSYITTPQHDGTRADRRFVPGPNSKGHAPKAVPGEEFLAEFPIEEYKQYIMRSVLGREPNDPRGWKR